MRAYADYVTNADIEYCNMRVLEVFNSWGLAYIDDDNIPKMVLFCPGEAYGNIVLSYSDDKVSKWTSWRCNTDYIPRSGLICNQDGSMGEYWDKVIRLENGQFTEIYNHTDMLYRGHDTVGTNEFYCILNGDTTLRVGDEMDCHQYDSKLNDIFYSKGNAITFGALDHLEVAILEKVWQPTPSDGATLADYKLTLSVQ